MFKYIKREVRLHSNEITKWELWSWNHQS